MTKCYNSAIDLLGIGGMIEKKGKGSLVSGGAIVMV